MVQDDDVGRAVVGTFFHPDSDIITVVKNNVRASFGEEVKQTWLDR